MSADRGSSWPDAWTPEPEEYAIGFAADLRNGNGGIAIGYVYTPNGQIDRAACSAFLRSLSNISRLVATLSPERNCLRFERCAMTEQDLEVIQTAVGLLENASLAARLTNIIGKPIELIGAALPEGASNVIAAATTKGLNAALKVALRTMENRPEAASHLFHKALATVSGAVGGSLGLVTAPLELPISTIIMLRSIADIARSEGEDLAAPETALSCVQVFALGGRTGSVDAAESGYFVVRGMLAKSITEAARFITERGIIEEGAPILVRFIAQIASRFGLVVTQKLAAQALPIVGALGGAAVNYAFIDHFQDVARGHFAIRRLERAYGKEAVRAQYERIRAAPPGSR